MLHFVVEFTADEAVDDLIANQPSTFIHEYIHFLQDLTLPYCIRENLVRLREFFLRVEHARDCEKINLPTCLMDADHDVTTRQSALTWGENGNRRNAGAILEISRIHETFAGPKGPFNVYKYLLSSERVDDYHLGARDLLEYIAYKIESRHFPGQAELPDLPYQSLDLMFEYFKLSSVSDRKRVAIAEYCLLNDNPIHRLMVIIEHLQNGGLEEANSADDDRFVAAFLNCNWVAQGQPFETIAEKIDRVNSTTKCNT